MNTIVLFTVYCIVWGVLIAIIITLSIISKKLRNNIEKFDEDTKTDYSVDILFGGALTPMDSLHLSASEHAQYVESKFAIMRDLDEFKEFSSHQLLGNEEDPVSVDYGEQDITEGRR